MKHAKSFLAAAAISLSSSLMGTLAFADTGSGTTDYVDPAWAAQIGAALSEAMPSNNPAFLRNSVAGESMVVRIQLDEAGNVTTFEFDSGYVLQVPQTLAIQIPASGGATIQDRDSNNPHIKRVRVVSTLEYYLVD